MLAGRQEGTTQVVLVGFLVPSRLPSDCNGREATAQKLLGSEWRSSKMTFLEWWNPIYWKVMQTLKLRNSRTTRSLPLAVAMN